MSGIASVFKKLFGLINFFRKLIVNAVFFLVLILVLGLLVAEEEQVKVPENGMLVLQLNGILVEEETWIDPVDQFFNEAFGGGSQLPEVLLVDVLESIEQAKTDDRISGIQLNLSNFAGGGSNKMQALGQALLDFRSAGKPVVTYADNYTQNQYYVAAHADTIYLNPLGSMMFEGFGGYNLYFKDFLEKFNITAHVFKVGAFKSAVEPYTRNDMSDEALAANKELYDELWDTYMDDLSQLRSISPLMLSGKMDDFRQALTQYDNDMAQLALNTGLVDALYSREQFRAEMIGITGLDDDEKSWRQINHEQYLAALNGQAEQLEDSSEHKDKAEIAIVVARGVISDGQAKPGSIGGDSTAALLRKARLDEDTKAVVLRIDSPGGSGFASEVIRQEVLELKKAGIPVIASMSSVAASGGYWIAASADEIWATPTTITGSIGVFGMFFTIEKALNEFGVYNDGYHTTDLPVLDITRGIDDNGRYLVQVSIEKFYRDFVGMVAESRNMSYDAVHEVAQGRIWTGRKAKELGLVDQLGELDDAISAAATRAGVSDYDVVTVSNDLSPREQFMQELFGQASLLVPSELRSTEQNPLKAQLYSLWEEVEATSKFNDPNGVYALCELCKLN